MSLDRKILIYGNGTLGQCLQKSLEFRGVNKNNIRTFDTIPERSSQDRSGLASAIEDTDIVLCCVSTPRRQERKDPDERYDLSGVFSCIRDLHGANYEGPFVIRTTVAPQDTVLIHEVCTNLECKFYPVYWPHISGYGSVEEEAMQPRALFFGVDRYCDNSRAEPFFEWLKILYAESIEGIAVAHPFTTMGVAQFMSVLTCAMTQAIREVDSVWKTMQDQNDQAASLSESMEILTRTGYISDVLISAIKTATQDRLPEPYMLEDTAAFSWEATMKEKGAWMINALNRRLRLDAEAQAEDSPARQ